MWAECEYVAGNSMNRQIKMVKWMGFCWACKMNWKKPLLKRNPICISIQAKMWTWEWFIWLLFLCFAINLFRRGLKMSRILNYDEEDLKEENPQHSNRQISKTLLGAIWSQHPLDDVLISLWSNSTFITFQMWKTMMMSMAMGNLRMKFLRGLNPCKRCSLIVHGLGPDPGWRFMYEWIEDRVYDASYCINYKVVHLTSTFPVLH